MHTELINALKKVPECRLRIIALAWKMLDKDGMPDPQILSFHSKELEEAITEAQEYTRATREIVCHLKELVHSQHYH